ncbi:MAG: chorismate lyase [Gammaproteobacteria bacterium]|nr:chorismate lyase [Gammaproteobacteria bacterium]MDH5692862.1 chorismate lyase [Gammaproteobacteria bacterium]
MYKPRSNRNIRVKMSAVFHPYRAQEALWKQATGFFLRRAPKRVRPWLVDQASLTARLIEASEGDFSVRVDSCHWARPLRSEAQVLGVSPNQPAYIRHVHLICKGEPWVFARTVIPLAHLYGPLNVLTRLGNKPLGAYLFSQACLSRDPIEVAKIESRHRLYRFAQKGEEKNELWGRRSVFKLSGGPLLVNEIFLPAMFAPTSQKQAASATKQSSAREKDHVC